MAVCYEQIEIWQEGLLHEVDFWDRWFATKGLQWPDDYERRLDPELPLSEYHCQFLETIDRGTAHVLDVGAGPLTLLGKKHPKIALNLVATDALADEYDAILAKYAISPPVRTVRCKTEDLDEKFPSDYFDLVNAQNCVDHSTDPLVAVQKMIHVTRAGGWVVLNHAEDEAENEHYEGLHQWNISLRDNDFMIRSVKEEINISQQLAAMGQFHCFRRAAKWVTVHIQKT